MKSMSDKTRKRYLECKPIRDALRESVGRCEVCDKHQSYYPLDVHEIARGVHRQKSLDKLFALLVVCRSCHGSLDSAKEWPEARQLAVLAERRLYDWDLTAYLELTSPKAPRRIELHEVVKFMSNDVLKVDEVAAKLRVNRRTAQSWIDSKELPAIDVRPEGAERAMWRVEPGDLLKFANDRKSVIRA